MLYFDIIKQLYEIGSIKFGSFNLKSGANCPFDIDLRLVLSHPSLLEALSKAMWQKIAPIATDYVCGIPYTAFSIATYISIKQNIPMLLKRTDLKEHPTKKIIAGNYEPNKRCLILEDVITSGHSILETTQALQNLQITVPAIAILLDREQGGVMAIEKQGFHVLSLLTISQVCTHLKNIKKITQIDLDKVLKFIEHNQIEF
ncbi:MAG: orotate phosphoribosyltransferase [Chlamydiota bacterium]